MLVAKKTGAWRDQYEIFVDGRPIARWVSFVWKSGGEVELAGRRYTVRSNAWGGRFGMVDDVGIQVASAERVGRKRWTVQEGARTYHFQRSGWKGDQHLCVNDQRVGSVKRIGFWRTEIVMDLPGVPLPVQIFVLGVLITRWNSEAVAGASAIA